LAGLILSSSKCRADAKDAVVTISCIKQGGRASQGTGFVLSSQGLIVTAYHVVEDANKIEAWGAGYKNLTNITVEYIDPDHDVAILKSDESPNVIGLNPIQHPPITPVKFTIIGSPNGINNLTFSGDIASAGYEHSTVVTSIDGTSSNIFALNIDIYLIDVESYGGISGAPIIAGNGEVIGFYSGSLGSGRVLGWAIPMKYVLTLLNTPAIHRSPNVMGVWPKLSLMASGSWNPHLRSYDKPYDAEHVAKLMALGEASHQISGVWTSTTKQKTIVDLTAGACESGAEDAVELTIGDLNEDKATISARISETLQVSALLKPDEYISQTMGLQYQIDECNIKIFGDMTADDLGSPLKTERKATNGQIFLSIADLKDYASDKSLSVAFNVTKCDGELCKPDDYGKQEDMANLEIISDDTLRWGKLIFQKD